MSPYIQRPLRSLDEAVAELKAKQAVAHAALTASVDREDRDPLAGTAWALIKTIDEDATIVVTTEDQQLSPKQQGRAEHLRRAMKRMGHAQ